MRRNTVFCGTVHLKRTDLDLKRLSARSDQCRMQRLIHIRFGHGNIVFETARNRFIFFVHDTQSRIAVFYGIHNDTDGKQIINLINGLVLVHHLFINGEEMLGTSGNLRFDASLFNFPAHIGNQSLYIGIPHIFAQCNLFHQIIVSLRLQIFKRKIFQFNLDLADTKTLRDRAVNLLCLTGDPLLCLLGLVF